jgi:predicted anti-sigma-YlaC factor YlaD
MKQQAHVLESACKEFEEDLVLYYYGEVPEAERRHIDNHSQQCRRCRDFLADLAKLLPHTGPKEFPPAFWHNYYNEVMEKLELAQLPWWQRLTAPMQVWLLPAFGTVAMALLAVALIFGPGGWNLQSESPESVPQEILVDAVNVEFFKSMDLLESLTVLEKMEGSGRESGGAQQL